MSTPFTVHMYTPDATVYAGEDVISLVVPAVDGFLGVLAHHASLVAVLSKGPVTIKDSRGGTTTFRIQGTGCLEVANNAATLLLEKAEVVQ